MISKLPKNNKWVIIIRMNRFDLEERIGEYAMACDDFASTLKYMIGDSEETPTEDELINVIIGFEAAQKYRYNRLWGVLETLIKQGVVTNKNCDLLETVKTLQGSPELTEQYQK